MFVSAGLIDAVAVIGLQESVWQFTEAGMKGLVASTRLTPGTLILEPRELLPICEQTIFEHVVALMSAGWEWKPLPKNQKARQELPCISLDDEHPGPICFYSNLTVHDSYLLCLRQLHIVLGHGIHSIQHGLPANAYADLLDGKEPPAPPPARAKRRTILDLDDGDADAHGRVLRGAPDLPPADAAPLAQPQPVDDVADLLELEDAVAWRELFGADADERFDLEEELGILLDDGGNGPPRSPMAAAAELVDLEPPLPPPFAEPPIDIGPPLPPPLLGSPGESGMSAPVIPPQPGPAVAPMPAGAAEAPAEIPAPPPPAPVAQGISRRGRQGRGDVWGAFSLIFKVNGQTGGYEATCPFHRGTATAPKCKKWHRMFAGELDHVGALLRAKIWCVSAMDYKRKRRHLRYIVLDDHGLAAEDVEARRIDAAPDSIMPDAMLDELEGVDALSPARAVQVGGAASSGG